MNYSDLLQDIREWMLNDDVKPERMVQLCEAKFGRDLRTRQVEVTNNITLTGREVALPTDYSQAISLSLDQEESILDLVSIERLRESRAYYLQGRPQLYAISGNNLVFGPTPSANPVALFTYYAKFVPLSATNQTNWLLDEAYDLYLYGSLLHAGPYIKDTADSQFFLSVYNDAMDSIREADTRSRYAGSSLKRIPAWSP